MIDDVLVPGKYLYPSYIVELGSLARFDFDIHYASPVRHSAIMRVTGIPMKFTGQSGAKGVKVKVVNPRIIEDTTTA